MASLPLIPGTLTSNCWTTPQALINEAFALGYAQLGDFTGIIISEATPPPEDRDKAWLKVVAGAPLYPYVAKWVAPYWVIKHPTPALSPERRMWAGVESLLITYDGGDNGTPGNASGPMWEVDHDFDARSPIGPGTLPSTAIITQGQNLGEENHVLSGAEGAVDQHIHPIGRADVLGNSANFPYTSIIPTAGYTGYLVSGSSGGPSGPFTDANIYTLAADNGAGVGSDGHNTIHPSRGIFMIKRTARIWIVVA